jgi:hypothetical protein
MAHPKLETKLASTQSKTSWKTPMKIATLAPMMVMLWKMSAAKHPTAYLYLWATSDDNYQGTTHTTMIS